MPEKFYMTPMGGNRENSSHKGNLHCRFDTKMLKINKTNKHHLRYLCLFYCSGYGLACVIDIMCNTLSGTGAGFLTGGGGLLFQAYDISSFCDIEVRRF